MKQQPRQALAHLALRRNPESEVAHDLDAYAQRCLIHRVLVLVADEPLSRPLAHLRQAQPHRLIVGRISNGVGDLLLKGAGTHLRHDVMSVETTSLARATTIEWPLPSLAKRPILRGECIQLGVGLYRAGRQRDLEPVDQLLAQPLNDIVGPIVVSAPSLKGLMERLHQDDKHSLALLFIGLTCQRPLEQVDQGLQRSPTQRWMQYQIEKTT